MSNAEVQARQNGEFERARADYVRARCLALDVATGVGQFNVRDGLQSAPCVGVPPTVGWDAYLVYFAGSPICVGPAYRSPWAVVLTEPVDGKVSVLGDDGHFWDPLPYSAALDLVPDDRVVIDWSAGMVIAEAASEADVTPVDPPSGGGGEIKTWTFTPVDSGSTQGSGWWTPRVFSSDSNWGAYFYQGIADTIPDSATILSVSLHLNAEQTQGGAPSIGLHSLPGKSGVPSVSSAVSIAGGTGDKALPLSFGDALKTGAALGLATPRPGGGYHIWSAANVGNSGALTITAQT